MNILWLSHLIPYPPKGGVLQRSYNMIKELSKYHDVHLLAFNQKDLIGPFYPSIDDALSDSKKNLSKFCNEVYFFDIPSDKNKLTKLWLAFRSVFTKEPYNINWLKSKKFEHFLESYLKNTSFDFVVFDTISLILYFDLCSDIPSALDHHNIESHMLIRRATKEDNFLKRWYFKQEGQRLKRYEKKFCPNYSFNFTCSSVDSQRLRELSPKSTVETIPNGVDISYFYPWESTKDQDQTKSLIFAGTLSWYPNTEAVLFIAQKIWPLLKQEAPDVVIDIIGANPPPQIQQYAEQDPKFRVHGLVDDLRAMINSATVYICPIFDGGGTKLKILDALAMGKAIIATRLACEGIEVTNGLDVLFAETPEEFATGVVELFSNTSARKRLGHNARKLAEEKYSYTFIGKSLSVAIEKHSK
ncbi:MAG TPA: glycosyltransferase [Gammaproteobacteria bacterium]|nr:glycosyltransferase [Gammaproteobacteria bacterium]